MIGSVRDDAGRRIEQLERRLARLEGQRRLVRPGAAGVVRLSDQAGGYWMDSFFEEVNGAAATVNIGGSGSGEAIGDGYPPPGALIHIDAEGVWENEVTTWYQDWRWNNVGMENESQWRSATWYTQAKWRLAVGLVVTSAGAWQARGFLSVINAHQGNDDDNLSPKIQQVTASGSGATAAAAVTVFEDDVTIFTDTGEPGQSEPVIQYMGRVKLQFELDPTTPLVGGRFLRWKLGWINSPSPSTSPPSYAEMIGRAWAQWTAA